MEDIRDPVGMGPHLGGGGEGLVGGEAQAMKGIADAGHPGTRELVAALADLADQAQVDGAVDEREGIADAPHAGQLFEVRRRRVLLAERRPQGTSEAHRRVARVSTGL